MTKTIKLESDTVKLNVYLNKLSVDELFAVQTRLNEYIDNFIADLQVEDDLLQVAAKLEHSRNVHIAIKRGAYKRSPKYKFKDKGVYKTWAGCGLMPNALKSQINENKKLSDFLIDKKGDAKYQFKDQNGEVKTWSGTGKRPYGLSLLVNKGYPLSSFLIK